MKSKTQKGFTLIELIIVTFIVASISAITISSFRESEKRRILDAMIEATMVYIRAGQSLSQSGTSLDTTCGQGKIIAEASNPFVIGEHRVGVLGYDKCGNYSLLGEATFGYTYISSMSVNGTPASTFIDLRFKPPYAKMTASVDGGPFNPFNTLLITLQSTQGPHSKSILVDGISGRVSVQ